MKITRNDILQLMQERILILDGATGTYIQQLKLTEEDFRGSVFHNHPQPLKGCNDVLCITKPEAIIAMHRAYIEAGADIIETNSFNCNIFSLADYGLQDYVYEISKAAAECARKAVESLSPSGEMSERQRGALVAGSMGPTNRTLSISPEVNDPAKRDITFQQLYDTYYEQARGLMDGGADILLVETIFDTLNAKAALKAISDLGDVMGYRIPVICSGTLSDASGRTLSGQTVEAFYASLSHYPLTAIGLNCGFGAKQLLPWIKRLAKVAQCPVSVHPNAGLPNVMGGYDETPETFAEVAREFIESGLVNIYGGCCGTTPEHIRALTLLPNPPHQGEGIDSNEREKLAPSMILSGLEYLNIPANSSPSNVTTHTLLMEGAEKEHFISIGERTNVAGSLKFKRLIKEGNYEEALTIARAQVSAGADIIDVCMDDGMIDGVKAMTHFLNLIASEPEIARVPVMIDSSKWEILEAGLRCVQGKSIVNSISLKEGEEKFLQKARHIMSMGAATVVMLFDEEGQADTYERKMVVARRAYSLLKGIGFPTEDIIFDPNVLSIATGMPEHDDYGRAFIEACRTIKEEMPEVHLSGGISNLSFSFRGNNTVRQAMHSVFLHHAMKAGLDMSIVNPAMTTNYSDIASPLKETVEAVVLNTSHEASEKLIVLAQQIKEEEEAMKAAAAGNTVVEKKIEEKPKDLKERIVHAMLKGLDENIEKDALEALQKEGNALAVIEHYLMPAMEQVGKLFGEGKMFLPQVVKSARVMKKAVGVIMDPLSPSMEISEEQRVSGTKEAPLVLMATVKGDVHDIGKNIVSVVLQCNGYEVKDLGVMVEPETIVEEAIKCNASIIGLSGLITPSLTEMINVVKLLEARGMTIPVIVGGATTSALHTAVKMSPEYPHGVVIRAHAAADNPGIIRHLLSDDREQYIAELKAAQRIVRDNYLRCEADKTLLSLEEARKRRHVKKQEEVAVPRSTEQVMFSSSKISMLKDRIDWPFFYQAWGLKGENRKGEEAEKLRNDAEAMLQEMEEQKLIELRATARIVPACSTDNDEIVLSVDGKRYTLPFPRSLKDEKETHCLADYVMRQYAARQLRQCPCCFSQHATDFVAPFVVTAGIGLQDLQERYRKDNDEYHAIMAKLLCDRLAEALAEYMQDYLQKNLFWGITDEAGKSKGVRMAFGYGACPDHALKVPVFNILKAQEQLGISLTETNMITPGESICGIIFANTPEKYFNV